MSIFYDLVLNSVCRSNHHRIVVMALTQLRTPAAGRWRDLFLRHHKELLNGAKAPDEVFKDFKNHVLHVRDGFWGGAADSAEEWRKRSVRALTEHDWPLAAYSVGVMSHYLADPIQPFHTGQTETENVIHRAVEWSFSKSFRTLKRLLDEKLGGFPDVETSNGPDWVADMVRAGAVRANAHYEAVIDHYDFDLGSKDPEAGLDQELQEIIAGLLGYAVSLVAHVLDKAIEEAAVAPPEVNLTPDLIFTGLKTPLRAVLASVENVQERALVASMYAEYQKTGKVRETLPEDDRAVRKLYAAEVLRVPLSSLDCAWPSEIGAAHGKGAAAPAPQMVADPSPPPIVAPPIMAPKEASDADARAARVLRPSDAVVDAPAIGPKTAERLSAIGVASVADLLALDAEDAARRMETGHIQPQTVRDWQDQARLACAIPALTSMAAQMLVACEVRDPSVLAQQDPQDLSARIAAFAASPAGQRALRDAKPPSAVQVTAWIAAAAPAKAA